MNASHSGNWSETSIAGHPCDIFEPPQRNKHGYVVLYLHGVHQNRLIDKQPFIDEFIRHGLPVVGPRTGESWWSDRISPSFDPQMSAEQFVMKEVLPFLADRYAARPPGIALLGTSMGGQGALRFAYKYPDTFPVTAAISPAIDYHLRIDDGDEVLEAMYGDPERARQNTAILHVHPLNWPRHQFFCCDPLDVRWWDSTDRLRMKLASLGVPHECDLETSGGGHGFDYYNRMAPRAISFLVERLDRERLRLPITG